MKIFNFLTNKLVQAFLGFLIQAIILIWVVMTLNRFFISFYLVMDIIAFVTVLYMNTKTDINPIFLQSWYVIILGIPIFGPIIYLVMGNRKTEKAFRIAPNFKQFYHNQILKEQEINIEISDSHLQKTINYLESIAHYPIYDKTKTQYFASAEEGFRQMVRDIQAAETFIFMEYYIIKEGTVWQMLLDILIEKAKAGVDVRLIYDDFGASFIDAKYHRWLQEQGIKAVCFNPLSWRVLVTNNNRDHRKITVVDGKVGYVGGANLADEYVNLIERFGHWKDNGIRIEGEAVFSLTEIFLSTYHFYVKKDENVEDFYVRSTVASDGYVQPYADAPADDLYISETIHLNMINTAKDYCYIFTPYLIIGYDMIKALTLAAQGGVDVRLVVPGIPDKKLVNLKTKSLYPQLIKAGVKIYEYSPGFVHSKLIVTDDDTAIVSTVNMDFRSYYLNFECGIVLYESQAVIQARDDFLKTLEVCDQQDAQDIESWSIWIRLLYIFINLFSGLM